MTPERWKTIEALYNEVVDLPAEERAKRLAASGDPEIAREVQSLFDSAGTVTSPEMTFWWSGLVTDAKKKAADSAAGAANLPRNIGPLRIDAVLGKGGMGEVYLAEDVRLGRRVAVKLLPVAFAAEKASMERFQQEARTASALNHPNIVTVHEFGEDEGRPYIVTEYVEGHTVRALVANGPLPFPRCLSIAAQTAAALAAAHKAGIVHRDIKPANIMVRPDGFVKVLDFGLAKLLSPVAADAGPNESTAPANVTRPGMILGTPGYMSPEQARGQAVDARSDLFSLGVVLYEMLTGSAPFTRGTTIETLAALLEREPPALSSRPGVPAAIISIADRMLRKDPTQRYQSAAELAEELRRLQVLVDSGRLGDSPRLETTGTRIRANRWYLIPAGVLVLALAAGVGYRMRTNRAEWHQSSRLTAIPGNGASHTQVLSPDGRYIAFDRLLPDGNRNLSVRLLAENSVVELVAPAAVSYDALAFSPDGSYLYYVARKLAPGNAGILFLVPVLGGTPRKVVENAGDRLAVSPDGSALAFVRGAPLGSPGERVLAVAAPDGSGEREVLRRKGQYAFQSLDWSPDRRELIYVETTGNPSGADCRIFAIGREGGTPRLVAHPGPMFIYDIAALPDGSGFIANAFDGDVGLPQIWHIPRNGNARRITNDLSQYQGLSLSRDGKRILTSHVVRISELWVVDRDDPTSARLVAEEGRRFDTPVWTRDGSIVSARFDKGKWILWATDQDGHGRPLLQKSGPDLEPSACPDRDEVVFASDRSGGYAIWRASNSGADLKQLTFGPFDRLPQCIAGGSVLYQSRSGDRRATMRVPLDGGQATTVSSPTYDQLVSPNGQMLLSTFVDEKTHERRIAVRSLDQSKVLGTYPYGGRAAAWSPDSRGFADARAQRSAWEIWYQPLAGGSARQLTHFGKDTIFGLAWSPDGRHLVCARGRFNSDMILIQDPR